MGRVFKTFLAPEPGHRTYRLMLLALIAGTSIAAFCIIHGSDLLGASALVTAVTAPVCGFGAMNNRQVNGVKPNDGKEG